MKVLRTQNMTPEVYTSTSRDFQLIGRIFDVLINGIKFDVDSILNINDTYEINSRLLSLLQTKLGFFSELEITDEDLRYVLKAFPIIVKNKGSIIGVEQAVKVFLKLNNIKSDVQINVVRNSESNPYTVEIGLEEYIKDTSLLNEILKYVLPTGTIVSYKLFTDKISSDISMDLDIGANFIVVNDSVGNLIRGSYIGYTKDAEDRIIGSAGVLQSSLPYNTTYMGTIKNITELPTYDDEEKEFHVGESYVLSNDGNVTTYLFSKLDDTFDWVEVTNESFETFDSSKEVYFSEDMDEIYENKKSEFVESSDTNDDSDEDKNDGYIEEAEVVIGSDSTVDDAFIVPSYNRNILPYDPYNDVYWFLGGNRWFGADSETSILYVNVLDDGNTFSIYPKYGYKLYRPKNDELGLNEAVFVVESVNNNYVWSNEITDKDMISKFISIVDAVITDEPDNTKITRMGRYCAVDIDSGDVWRLVNEAGEEIWRNLMEGDNPLKTIRITGNPNGHLNYLNGASIDPNYCNSVYRLPLPTETIGTFYVANKNVLTEQVTPVGNVLYLDRDSGNGYKYTENSTFEKVIHYVRAQNIYDISYKDFIFMLENNMIKPAFKNESTIFEDSFGNVLIL